MTHRCTRCGREWDNELATDNDLLCTRKCSGTLVPLGTPAGPIDDLPSIVAIPWNEYLAEPLPVLRLHRMCDAVEVLVRFLTTTALSEVRRTLGEEPLPSSLLKEIHPRIERPTFGQWRGLLEALTRHTRNADDLVLPEQPGFVAEVLLPLLPGGSVLEEDCIVKLRNLLAHGGAMQAREARRYLDVWEGRVAELGQGLGFLSDALVGRVAGDRVHSLSARSLDVRLLPRSAHDRGLDGHVVLARASGVLDLWPLCDHGRATAPSIEGRRQASSEGPLVYFRSEADRLLYAALGVDLPFGERRDVVSDFRALFRLDGDGRLRARGPIDFEAEIRADADSLIGRRSDLAIAKGVIKETQSGVLWLSGPGGIGKSYLTARIALDLGNDPRRICRVAWRFKASDRDRCNRAAFLRHAILRIAGWLGHTRTRADDDVDGMLSQLREILQDVGELAAPDPRARPPRALFVLDGLDEISRIDPGVARLPFELGGPNVVWLCAGRPEGDLPSIYARDRCKHVFEDGLGPMDPGDIRAMLVEGTGRLKYELLRADVDIPDREEVENRLVDEVARHARGLPLYVRFVVQDLLAGHLSVADLASRLPPSLDDYYDDLLHRMSLGDLQALLTPLVTTVAWARAPLAREVLECLMVRRKVLVDDEAGSEILDEGLRTVSAMLRWTPMSSGEQLGVEPYHLTFRMHVRESARMRLQGQLASAEYCNLSADWAQLREGHVARDYLARHGLAHCAASGATEAALSLVEGVAAGQEWNHIASLAASMQEQRVDHRDLVDGLLVGRLGEMSGSGARLTSFLYRLRQMPSTVAGVIEESAHFDSPLGLTWWLVGAVANAMKFVGVLAACDSLHTGFPPPRIFDQLRRPSMGVWAQLPLAYYRAADREGAQVAFPDLADLARGRIGRGLAEKASRLVHTRNQLAHGGAPHQDEAEKTLTDFLQLASEYLELLDALTGAELLVYQYRDEAGSTFLRLRGPRPRLDDPVVRPFTSTASPGEVFFRWGENEPISLRPFVLFDEWPGAGAPLLLYERWSGRQWTYVHAGDGRQRTVPGTRNEGGFRETCRGERTRTAPSESTAGGHPLPPVSSIVRTVPGAQVAYRADLPHLSQLARRWSEAVESNPAPREILLRTQDLLRGALDHAFVTELAHHVACAGGPSEHGSFILQALQQRAVPSRRLNLLQHLGSWSGIPDRDTRLGELAEPWIRWFTEARRFPGMVDEQAIERLHELAAALARLGEEDPVFAAGEFHRAHRPDRGPHLLHEWPDGTRADLDPWLVLATCPECDLEHAFVLDSIPRRGSALLVDPLTRHVLRSEDVARIVVETLLGT